MRKASSRIALIARIVADQKPFVVICANLRNPRDPR
jgi:hypothetical protein